MYVKGEVGHRHHLYNSGEWLSISRMHCIYRLVDLLSAALMFTSVLNLCWPELSSWLFLFFRPKYLLHEENDDTT